MSVKSRIISIRLMEKVRDYPEYAKEIGLNASIREKDRESNIEKDNKGERSWEKEQQIVF